jgi:hypothetical protein
MSPTISQQQDVYLIDMIIEDQELDEDISVDPELEIKLIFSIFDMDSDLWEDIVRFLNKHKPTQLAVRLPLVDCARI